MRLLFALTILLFVSPLAALADDNPFKSRCPASIDTEACTQLGDTLMKIAESKLTGTGESSEDIAKKGLLGSDFVDSLMRSPYVKAQLGTLPFEATFKVLDVEDGDSVLAVDFNYQHKVHRTIYGDEGANIKSYGFDVNISGTATQDDEKNPKNLIDTTISFSLSSLPNFGVLEAIPILTQNLDCTNIANINDPTCARLLAEGQKQFFKPIGHAFYTEYGIDIGYETDQTFDANNTKISAFFSTTYEDLSKATFLGANGIAPSIRLSIDSVSPSSDTPRSMAGDETNFERFSGEFHLNVPLINLFNLPYLFSFNYRTYNELGASDIVKEAGLDKHRLRTYSISAPKGLVVSYSSGRLPFGLEEEQVIEVGFKTYF